MRCMLAEPGCEYDEAGLLSADLSAFVELRILQQSAAGCGPALAGKIDPAYVSGASVDDIVATSPAGSLPQAEAAADELGPSRYSQLGPPRPSSRVITAEGGWASLYEQLQRRREQLTQGTAAATEGTPSAPHPVRAAAHASSAPPAERGHMHSRSASDAGRRSSLTPGATRPRAGVRRTALGPMLRVLRDAQEL